MAESIQRQSKRGKRRGSQQQQRCVCVCVCVCVCWLSAGRWRLRGLGPTSHLSLQAQDDLHGLLEDDEFSLSLVALQMQLHHAAELPEGLVNVAHSHPLPSVISHAPLALTLLLLLSRQMLLRHAAARGDRRSLVI